MLEVGDTPALSAASFSIPASEAPETTSETSVSGIGYQGACAREGWCQKPNKRRWLVPGKYPAKKGVSPTRTPLLEHDGRQTGFAS